MSIWPKREQIFKKIVRLTAKKGESMTRKEAKRELRPIKNTEKDIKSIELEIERLMAIATRMTTNLNGINVQGSPTNKIEEALIKVEEYRVRLSKILLQHLDYKNKCLNKVSQIQPASLRKVLIYYYFQDKTLEQTAEIINKSERYTHTMFDAALDEYCKIS